MLQVRRRRFALFLCGRRGVAIWIIQNTSGIFSKIAWER